MAEARGFSGWQSGKGTGPASKPARSIEIQGLGGGSSIEKSMNRYLGFEAISMWGMSGVLARRIKRWVLRKAVAIAVRVEGGGGRRPAVLMLLPSQLMAWSLLPELLLPGIVAGRRQLVLPPEVSPEVLSRRDLELSRRGRHIAAGRGDLGQASRSPWGYRRGLASAPRSFTPSAATGGGGGAAATAGVGLLLPGLRASVCSLAVLWGSHYFSSMDSCQRAPGEGRQERA